MTLLALEDLHAYYGEAHILQGVSLTVGAGEVVTLIGRNGAGKTTTLKSIMGLVPPRGGRISFDGRELTKLPTHEVARAGIAYVPEGRGIFPKLTVRENLELGAFTVNDQGKIDERMQWTFELFPRLKERIEQKGGTLSGGEQQMLAIARGLMLHPRILMLDEPSMGLAPVLVELIFDVLKQLNQEGTTILLVEQNALMALSIAHRGYVLQTGQIVISDTAENLKKNPTVQKAYLGIE